VVESACVQGSSADFVASFQGSFAFYHIFLEADHNSNTGYGVPGTTMGADYMVENAILYRSTGPAWGWYAIDHVNTVVSGNVHHWSVPLSQLHVGIGNPLSVIFEGNQTGGVDSDYSPTVDVSSC
jgi:hypothetical protein